MRNAIPIASKLYMRDVISIAPKLYMRDAISIAPKLYMRSQSHRSPTVVSMEEVHVLTQTSSGEKTLATLAYQSKLALVPFPLGAAINKIKSATLILPSA
jgi:hypothetical protein